MKALFTTAEHARQTSGPAVPDPNRSPEILDHKQSSIFNGIFDDFVATAANPSPTIEIRRPISQMHGPKETIVYSRDDVLDVKYEQLRGYIEYHIQDVSRRPILSVEELDAKVDTFISDGVKNAQDRWATKHIPGHISYSDVDPDPENTSRFKQIVEYLLPTPEAAKKLGNNVLELLHFGPHPISSPQDIVSNNVASQGDQPREIPLPYSPGNAEPGYDSTDIEEIWSYSEHINE